MGRVSTCQKNCNTIDLRRAQVNKLHAELIMTSCAGEENRFSLVVDVTHLRNEPITGIDSMLDQNRGTGEYSTKYQQIGHKKVTENNYFNINDNVTNHLPCLFIRFYKCDKCSIYCITIIDDKRWAEFHM